MRNLTLVSSAIALALALASFAPSAWTTSGSPGTSLSSISVHDLTLASGPLNTLDYADAH